MTIYKSNVVLPTGAAEPDAYDSRNPGVPAEFVVSRDDSGKPVSYYRDNYWDWTPYAGGRREGVRLTLSPWLDEALLNPAQLILIDEVRWLMFLMIYRRVGPTVSVATLQQYLNLFRNMGRFAEKADVSIRQILADQREFDTFLKQLPMYQFQHLGTVLGILNAIPDSESGYALPWFKEMSRQVYAVTVKYAESLRQTTAIPTRIYSQILATLLTELAETESIAHPLGALVREAYRRKKNGDRSARIPELVIQHGLSGHFAKNEVVQTIHGLSKELTRIQVLVKTIVHAFSGMRDMEVVNLPMDCLVSETYDGRRHTIIKGFSTKFNNGLPKPAQWVTNRDGERAINLAKQVAAWITESSSFVANQATLPLFVPASSAGVALDAAPKGHRRGKPDKVLNLPTLQLLGHPTLCARLQPLIQEEDLVELEQIDPSRDWRGDPEYQLGAPWPLKTHQFRRSLALYAQRSGLVSLPSLRRQLQHLTEEMSLYYAKGSTFAKNFIGDDKEHFGLEWQDTQPLSAGLSYIWNVLLSDEVLFGGHGNWVQQRRKDPATAVTMLDRETTLTRFKKGELVYRETAIGGCVNVKGCDQIGLRWLDADCIAGCKNLVVHESKLSRAIQAQQHLVAGLDPDSIEYRMEKADLDALLAGQQKIIEAQD